VKNRLRAIVAVAGLAGGLVGLALGLRGAEADPRATPPAATSPTTSTSAVPASPNPAVGEPAECFGMSNEDPAHEAMETPEEEAAEHARCQERLGRRGRNRDGQGAGAGQQPEAKPTTPSPTVDPRSN